MGLWLIAEDEADIRNLVQMMFTVWGHQTIVFENGQKVWNWLDTLDAGTYDGPLPDMAVMDIRMPGKRGDELARRMGATPALQHMPIVLMTAYALNEDQEAEIRANGADYIIHKPLPDFERFHAILNDVLYSKHR